MTYLILIRSTSSGARRRWSRSFMPISCATTAFSQITASGAACSHRPRHTTINLNTTVGHDCVIGDYCTVAPGVGITGHVTIGEGALIQTHAAIVPGIRIGAWAKVGPGSVVLRDVADGDSVFGNPARKMLPGTH